MGRSAEREGIRVNPALMMLMGRRVAPWTPASLSGLFAWYDAADAATITASGVLVSAWNDKSGNARHMTQSDNARKLSTGTRTINSLNTIESQDNGASGDSMWTGAVTVPSSVTVCAVLQFDSFWVDGGVAVSFGNGRGYSPRATGTAWSIRGDSTSVDITPAPSTGTAYCTTSILNGSSSLLRVNGTQIGTGNTGTLTGSRIAVSAALTAGGYGIDGIIGEVVIASGVLAGADLTSLETYLKTKWGIA